MRPGSLRRADVALLLFALLYLAGVACMGWQIGRDWPAVGLPGFLFIIAGAACCWLGAIGQMMRVVIRGRRYGPRWLRSAMVVTLVLGLSPLAAGVLNDVCREAGARHQLGIADLDQVRRDCTALIQEHRENPHNRVIHVNNPAFEGLPESVLKLNPLMVRITSEYVEITRYAMIARQEGIRVVPKGAAYRPPAREEEIAEGIYCFAW